MQVAIELMESNESHAGTAAASAAASHTACDLRNADDTRLVGVHQNHNSAATPNDESFNVAVASFQDALTDWAYGGRELAPILKKIRTWSAELWQRFIPRTWNGRDIAQPPVCFVFCEERPNINGHYRTKRNQVGMKWEISINPRCLSRACEAEVASTVLHELSHCFEDLAKPERRARRTRSNYHTMWFREHAHAIGIPCSVHGERQGIIDGSRFASWATQRGLSFQGAMLIPEPGADVRRGPAKRENWVCDCPEVRLVRVMVATGKDLKARCLTCGGTFRRVSDSAREFRPKPEDLSC